MGVNTRTLSTDVALVAVSLPCRCRVFTVKDRYYTVSIKDFCTLLNTIIPIAKRTTIKPKL